MNFKFYEKNSKVVKCKDCSLEELDGVITQESYNYCSKKIKEKGESSIVEFRLLKTPSNLFSVFAAITKKDIEKATSSENNSDWRKTVLKKEEKKTA